MINSFYHTHKTASVLWTHLTRLVCCEPSHVHLIYLLLSLIILSPSFTPSSPLLSPSTSPSRSLSGYYHVFRRYIRGSIIFPVKCIICHYMSQLHKPRAYINGNRGRGKERQETEGGEKYLGKTFLHSLEECNNLLYGSAHTRPESVL
jgi:hypothetical protein